MEETLKKPSAALSPEKSGTGAHAAAQAYCATVVANIEGWRHPLQRNRQALELPINIQSIDSRIRALEVLDGTASPPPMETPTWDGLSWRAARMHKRMPVMDKARHMPSHVTCSLDLLVNTINGLGGIAQPAQKADMDATETLRFAAQNLSYLAGQRGYKIIGSFDLEFNCILALDLSLDNDSLGIGPYVTPVRGAYANRNNTYPRPMASAVTKSCCGCCDCYCHDTRLPPTPRARSRNPSPRWIPPRRRRAPLRVTREKEGGFWSKLAFWRKGKDNRDGYDSDDSRSVLTRTESTMSVGV